MGVRILCLHGQGSNSAIFRQQMGELSILASSINRTDPCRDTIDPIRKLLPNEYEFCYFDGDYECEPSPEVLDSFPPPYLTWYNSPTTEKVIEAHTQVRRLVNLHGPFDAVLGFSQGAAVSASMLLHQALEGEDPLFSAAIFIGSPVPFSHRLDVGIDARTYFGVSGNPPNEHARPTTIPMHLVTDPAYLRSPAQLEGKQGDVRYQMFHATIDAVRLRIPTGHIFGTRDKWFMHSRDLVGLCDKEQAIVLRHDGGHEIPRAYADEVCDVIETVLSKLTSGSQ